MVGCHSAEVESRGRNAVLRRQMRAHAAGAGAEAGRRR